MLIAAHRYRSCSGIFRLVAAATAAATLMAAPALAETRDAGKGLTLVASDNLRENGFLQYLKPLFEKRHGIAITILIRGAGMALSRAQRGEADALLIDDFEGEQRIVAAGHGTSRNDVMYGELIVVGPAADPAGIRGMASVIDALQLIATAESPFLSRGDDSGIDRAERRYWEEAGIDAGGSNAWYKVTGADMRTTLGMAHAQQAYTVTDRATWLAFKGRGGLAVAVAGDPRMIHQYGVVPINPEKHAGVNGKAAATFVEWLGSKSAQDAIARFMVAGEAPYVPNFGQRPSDPPPPKKSKRKSKK